MKAKHATGRFHMLTQQRLTQAGLAGPGVQSEGQRYRSQLEQANWEPEQVGLRTWSALRVRQARPGVRRSSDPGQVPVTRRSRPDTLADH